MVLEHLCPPFSAARLTRADLPDIYRLCLGNPQYYRYCPPAPTPDSIRADLAALPPGVDACCKYFIGFRREGTLIAVADLILGYPDAATAYIGLFMVDAAVQGQGIGSRIFSGLADALRQEGFARVRLACMQGNRQSEGFWRHNGFLPTGEVRETVHGTALLMQRTLHPLTERRKLP